MAGLKLRPAQIGIQISLFTWQSQRQSGQFCVSARIRSLTSISAAGLVLPKSNQEKERNG